MSTLNDRDRENLTAYLDGELDRKTAQDLEAKINLDPEARQEVEALKKAWGLLDYLPKPSTPADFTHRTLERLSLEKLAQAAKTGNMARHRAAASLRAAGWVAAIVLAAGVGLGAAQLMFPKPDVAVDIDEPLVRYLPILEKWRLYKNALDLDFVRALDHPELFGDEPGS